MNVSSLRYGKINISFVVSTSEQQYFLSFPAALGLGQPLAGNQIIPNVELYDSGVRTMWRNSVAVAAGRFAGRLLGVAVCCRQQRTLCSR